MDDSKMISSTVNISQEDKNILLQQWQTCVEMANSVSQRRDSMNNIFVTLNLAIIAAVSFAFNLKTVFLLIAGIIICRIWLKFINNFRLLNQAKFEVIDKIEDKLPVAPFTDEWAKLRTNNKYKEGTWLEKIMPYMFIVLYLCMTIIVSTSVIKK